VGAGSGMEVDMLVVGRGGGWVGRGSGVWGCGVGRRGGGMWGCREDERMGCGREDGRMGDDVAGRLDSSIDGVGTRELVVNTAVG